MRTKTMIGIIAAGVVTIAGCILYYIFNNRKQNYGITMTTNDNEDFENEII